MCRWLTIVPRDSFRQREELAMTEIADITNKYGTSLSATALSLQVLFDRPMLPKAESEFKSFKLGIAVIPIKRMYLERFQETLTGQ